MLLLLMSILPIMVQRHAIELLKRIRQHYVPIRTNLPARRPQPAIQRHAREVRRAGRRKNARRPDTTATAVAAPAEVRAARALLDGPEVDGRGVVAAGSAAAVGPPRDHGRGGVAQQRPLGRSEEGVAFDVSGAGARAEAAAFVLEQELADEGFAETAIIR